MVDINLILLHESLSPMPSGRTNGRRRRRNLAQRPGLLYSALSAAGRRPPGQAAESSAALAGCRYPERSHGRPIFLWLDQKTLMIADDGFS
ncbi:hypothetical protein I5I77_08225 [Pseudomonas aeruginosa]|nr:hypothetical protein [Pseudomonas aeruginosa]